MDYAEAAYFHGVPVKHIADHLEQKRLAAKAEDMRKVVYGKR